jgi:hypothetical protein
MKTLTRSHCILLMSSTLFGCAYSPRNNAHLTHAWDQFSWAGADIQPNAVYAMQVMDHGNWGPPLTSVSTSSTVSTTDQVGTNWYSWNVPFTLGVQVQSGVPLDNLWVPAGTHQKSIQIRTLSVSSGSPAVVFDDGSATDTCISNNQSGGGAQIISNCKSASGGSVTLFAPCGTKGEACCPSCDSGLACSAQSGISKCLVPPGGSCNDVSDCGGNSTSCTYGVCTANETVAVGNFSTTVGGVRSTLVTSFPGVGSPGNAAKFVPNQLTNQDVTFYNWPSGNGQPGGTGDQQGSNWACLPYKYTRMSGAAGSTVKATLARDAAGQTLGFAVRYNHGTCSFRADWKTLFFNTFSSTVQQVMTTEVKANEPGFGFISIARDYDFAQPQFTGTGTNPTWGFFYTAKFTANYSISLAQNVANVALYMSPGYSFAPSSDGHVTVTPLTQGVVLIPEDNTRAGFIKTALKTDAPATMQSQLTQQLDQPVSTIAKQAGITLTATCDRTADLSKQQKTCFSEASSVLQKLDPNGAITPTNFSCLSNNQCGFHPIVQAVNVLPDSLEFVFSPSVTSTGPDYLTPIYQAVDAAQRKAGGFHMCSDPDPQGVTTGSPELMWNGADGVFNTECGLLLE